MICLELPVHYSVILVLKELLMMILGRFSAKTALLGFIVLLWGFAWVIGQALGQPDLLFVIGIFSLFYAGFSYFAGSKMALAVNGAKEIQKSDDPRLWRIVENLSIANGLPTPKIYIMDDPAPNAFATGRDPNHSAVCATRG